MITGCSRSGSTSCRLKQLLVRRPARGFRRRSEVGMKAVVIESSGGFVSYQQGNRNVPDILKNKMNIELRILSPNDPATGVPHPVRGPLNRPSMAHVGRDQFVRELAAEPGAHAQVIRAAVRAFLSAALRGSDVRTPDGWRSVIQDMRYVLGDAMGGGVEQVRPVSQPASPRPLVVHDPRIPIAPKPKQDEAEHAPRQGLPVHLVHALVRAYVAARMSGEEAATPEGRSRILGETRELVWDGILDAVKQVPCPSTLHPQESPRPPRRSRPERER